MERNEEAVVRRKLQMEEMGRISAEEFKRADKAPLVVVLDEIRSQNNVGSLFRTADAFRLERLVLCGITATPPTPEIHKTALGAELSVAWEHADDTLSAVRRLKAEGYLILALEQAEGSVMLNEFVVGRGVKYALVVGNEVNGVRQEVVSECDACLEIPQFGTKHSLNVSVSAGMAIWEIVKQNIEYRGYES